MILLTIVVSLAEGTGIQYVHLGIVAAESIGFALIMIFLAPRVVGRMEPGLQRMSTNNAPLILALAICLGFSVLATKIGMAAIIGAFFAGLIFSDYSPRWRLDSPVKGITEFLTPFFFFTMGARLDLHTFTPDLIVAAAIVAFLALISKVIGCGLPVLHEGWRTALKVGVGMTPRGEVALIVALIGLQMNMVSQRAYAIVILMTAITTILPPPFLRILFRDEMLDAEVEEEETVPADV
jgi:Kef-type K+ transport system membrane component KefB